MGSPHVRRQNADAARVCGKSNGSGEKQVARSSASAESSAARTAPTNAPVAFDGRSILPGWHMNKRSWFTLVLDGSLPLRRIQSLIRRSRDLALRR